MTLAPLALAALVFHAAPEPTPEKKRPYDSLIRAAAEDATKAIYPLPANLVRAVIRQESDFDPSAVSPAGAIGLMQVMPFNASRLGLTPEDLREPEKNLRAGARLLATLLKHYRGDVISALIAYNAHPREFGSPVPRNGETPIYVRNVLRYFREFEHEDGHEIATTSTKKRPAPSGILRPSQVLADRP